VVPGRIQDTAGGVDLDVGVEELAERLELTLVPVLISAMKPRFELFAHAEKYASRRAKVRLLVLAR
jgi:hypothetical protein